ncbi:MAG: HTH domain-containing protein [Candidatus Altimarinota bacterium]
MANFFNAAKKILKDYDYLNYKEIVELGLGNGSLHTDGKTPILTMSSRLGSDIRMKGNKSTFIRIGDGVFALRKPLKEDNLLVYLKYRLKNFPFWQIDDKDEKYLLDIFGRNILADENIELLSLLKDLKKKNKIEDFNVVDGGIVINLRKEEKIFNPNNIDKKIEILTQETLKLKELGDQINKNSGIQEFSNFSQKLTGDFLNVFQEITKNTKALEGFGVEQLEGIEKTQKILQEVINSSFGKNLIPLFDSINQITEAFSKTELPKESLEELNKISSQINFLRNVFNHPNNIIDTLNSFESIQKENDELKEKLNLVKKWMEVEVKNQAYKISKIKTNQELNIKEKNEKTSTHTFEGYEQEGDFKTIRGYAHIQDLATISKAIYFDNGGVQRNEDKERCLKIKKYIESGNKRFFPEVILGLYINDDSIKIENSIKGDKRKDLTGLSSEIKTVQIDFHSMRNSKITRIDGNHRLFFADEIEKDFLIPFCFVIFDQKGESSDIQAIHKNQEANIFYLLNGKNEPVTSEEALQVLLNMPDEEAQSLYQNDSTLGLTRICKTKYENYLKACEEDTKKNFGDKIYTKFELLIKYIEKLGIENSKIDKLLDKVFSSIYHLDDEYNAIISRDDFLYLVLNVVLDNEDKTSSKLNKLLKEFFDWILKEGLENISSSEKPILWELFQKQKSFKETSDIHSFEVDENKYNGQVQGISYKEFISLINESRKKIILKDIEEKRIGLEKIVDAYSKLLDILGNGGTDNAQRVDNIVKRFFHSSDRKNMKKYLKDDFYDNLGKRVMNNDFAIRHHETNKEKLEDKQFIEFLYCEYDNAIKFILDKAGFLK